MIPVCSSIPAHRKKTMEAAGVLMGMGIDFPKIVDQTFFTKTYEQNRIMGLALVKVSCIWMENASRVS